MLSVTLCEGGIKMSNIVMIVAQSQFRDEELFDTKAVLEQEGHTVCIASRTMSPCIGNQGGSVDPDLIIADVDALSFDALVFVGGGGAKEYFEDTLIFSLIDRFDKSERIIAAICIAPVILANAGFLKGKRATVFPSGKDLLLNQGVIYTGESVTTDGRIVTGNGPASSTQFGKTIASLLKR
jgi:protease I